MAPPLIVVDAGPLVALLDRSEREHQRVVDRARALPSPFLTAEPVITETCFLLRGVPNGPRAVMRLLRDGLLKVALSVEQEAEALETLMTKYSDVPMSLADACLVRLAELNSASNVFTFDSDFRVYRRNGNKRLALVEF